MTLEQLVQAAWRESGPAQMGCLEAERLIRAAYEAGKLAGRAETEAEKRCYCSCSGCYHCGDIR